MKQTRHIAQAGRKRVLSLPFIWLLLLVVAAQAACPMLCALTSTCFLRQEVETAAAVAGSCCHHEEPDGSKDSAPPSAAPLPCCCGKGMLLAKASLPDAPSPGDELLRAVALPPLLLPSFGQPNLGESGRVSFSSPAVEGSPPLSRSELHVYRI